LFVCSVPKRRLVVMGCQCSVALFQSSVVGAVLKGWQSTPLLIATPLEKKHPLVRCHGKVEVLSNEPTSTLTHIIHSYTLR